MSNSWKIKTVSSYIKRYTLLLILVWPIIIFVLIVWNSIQVNKDSQKSAHIYTKAAFDKDVLYRRWSAMHGGEVGVEDNPGGQGSVFWVTVGKA